MEYQFEIKLAHFAGLNVSQPELKLTQLEQLITNFFTCYLNVFPLKIKSLIK
ncbi:hypothetical protein AN393_00178 [Pseudoalteromonas sp. P1-25]|nr:hypothetical protein AN393_00178 [Pseudoalteromonas sp. P1-25]